MRRLLVALVVLAAGCTAGTPTGTEALPSTTAPPPPSVTLTESTIDWRTHSYELTAFNTVTNVDPDTLVDVEFATWVLENEHLSVTLLPEFGGRIISLISKDTGREQLYRSPVGVPYQIGTGVFFFDWLMVYGGIFPTFPAPEHGKTWFAPWSFEVVEEAPDSITVAMSFTDTEDYPLSPPRYDGRATGLSVTWILTLASGRSAIDTEVVITNPGDAPVSFEYWTNATLAPGADPLAPAASAGTEIVAPIEFVKIPSYWTTIAASEQRTGIAEVHEFDRLRTFGGWDDLGIAYAWPDVRGGSAWGAINQDNDDGIIRIGDNAITPGLKLWTWGYERSLRGDPPEAGPYVELWAGLTREFFTSTTIDPLSEIRFPETWAITSGLEGVTDADEHFVIDARISGDAIELTAAALGGATEATLTASDAAGPLGRLVAEIGRDATPVTIPLDRPSDGPIEIVLTQPDGSSRFVLSP